MTITKVILEMAEAYNVFSRCIYFNLEMSEKYQRNIDRYIRYYTNIIRQIDIFLQEEQLKHTKLGFPLVPAPSYFPNTYELGCSNMRKIDNIASTEVKRVENKMVVIMQEHQEKEQNMSHNSFHSSFSRIRLEELNDMGYGLSKISPITFNGDAFQTPSNRAQDGALTLTPRRRNEVNTESVPPAQAPQQDGNATPYNAELSVTVQISHLAGLCLHNQITQVVLHRRWTTQTQQQYTMRSLLGNVKTSLLAYKCHPDTPNQEKLPPLLKQQTERLHRLVEPKLHLHHPPRSLHQQEEHKHPLQKVNHIGR